MITEEYAMKKDRAKVSQPNHSEDHTQSAAACNVT